MTIQALIDRLADIPDVVAFVGTRIFPVIIPQGEYRASIRVDVVREARGQHMRGPEGYGTTRFQVDSYVPLTSGVDANQQVVELAAAVRGDGLGPNATGLWGWIGTIASSPEAYRVMNVELVDGDSPTYEADQFRRMRMRQDYRVHWSTMQ